MDIKFKDDAKLKIAPYIKQLEYAKSIGGSSIVVSPSKSIALNEKFILKTHVAKSFSFGMNGTDMTDEYEIFGHNNTFYFDYRGRSTGGSFVLDTDYYIEIGNKYIKNLKTGNNILTASAVTQSVTPRLFKINIATEQKIYFFKDYVGDDLVMNLIPVIDLSGVVCFYDTVSETLFYNQGTGELIAGPAVKTSLRTDVLSTVSSLFHKNVPNVDFLTLLDGILGYQNTHQNEVKEHYYPTTQLWQQIVDGYPDIVQYYNVIPGVCVVICDSSNPQDTTEDLLQLFQDHQDIVSILSNYPSAIYTIAEYPMVADVLQDYPEIIHSLTDTGKESVLTASGDTVVKTGKDFPITESCTIDINIPALTNYCFDFGVMGSPDADNERQIFYTNSNLYYDYRGRNNVSFSGIYRLKMIAGNKYIKTNGVTNISATKVTSEITSTNFYISLCSDAKFYSCKKINDTTNRITMWLVPIENNGTPCMIDLITGTKYLNQTSGSSYTYSLEDK